MKGFEVLNTLGEGEVRGGGREVHQTDINILFIPTQPSYTTIPEFCASRPPVCRGELARSY